MGVRDALLLNTTGSNFQALQTNDTARLKGDLSLQKDDGTEVLGVDVSTATLNLSGGITGSGNISSSLSSTGSFGRVVATTFHGDGRALKSTLPRSVGIVTQSAQLAAQISGAFTEGFFLSSSISGGASITASFGRVEGVEFFGDGSGLSSTLPRNSGLITGSAQIASRISGSFNKGFNYEGLIGGATLTAGGTWSEGGSLIVPRHSGAMAGTQNAAFYIAGNLSIAHGWYGGGNQTCTEEYNGTSWSAGTAFPLDSEGTNLMPLSPAGPDPGNKAGTGAQNAALVFGGQSHYQTPRSTGSAFEYDGTAFTQVAFMPEPISCHIGAGTQNATISYGGSERALTSPYADTAAQYANTWDGSTWTNITATNNARQGHASTPNGTVNSTMAMGATANAPDFQGTECWNGSSWSEIAEQNVRRVRMGGAGSPDDAQVFGGQGSYGSNSPNTNGTSEYWNGITWNTGATMVRAAGAAGDGNSVRGAGTAVGALAAGGYPGAGAYTGTEEYTGGVQVTSGSFGRLVATTITGDATPIINKLPFPPGLISGSSGIASDISGSFNKGFGLTGNITTPPDAWSTGHDMNTCRYFFGAKGYVDAAIAAGGNQYSPHPATYTDNTEYWDGTSWTEVNNMSHGRDGGYGGTVESGYYSAGNAAPWSRTEEWNGTNWSEAPAFGERSGDVGGCSPTQVYGIGSMYDQGKTFKTYNAGVCTLGPNLSIGTCAPFYTHGISGRQGHAGNADCLLVFATSFTEEYNGTSWSVLSHNVGDYSGRYEGYCNANPNPAKLHGSAPNLACSVRGNTGAGTTNDAYSYGGEVGPIGGPAWYQGCGTAMFQRWDGTSWSRGVIPPHLVVEAQGIGDGSNAFVLGGRAIRYPSYQTGVIESGSIFLEGQSSASFGLLTFVSASGNAKSLQSQLQYSTNPAFNVLTGSGQIASQISGSFNKGFEFDGHIRRSTGGVISLGDSMIEAQTGATGGSMNKGTAFVAGGVYGTSRETCACHQQYNGTSWSEAADLNDARKCDIMASGDSTAAIAHGGGSGPATNKTEEWNGSAWSEVNTYYPARNTTVSTAGAGESSEAALRWGLYDAAEWNGTNWSEFDTTVESGLEGGHYNQAGTGTSNAALQFAGQTPHNFSSTGYDRSFRAFRAYDGSNWSECPNMIFMTQAMGSFGSANDAVVAGGNIMSRRVDGAPGPYGCINHAINLHPSLFSRSWHNQYWNGSTWSISGRLLCRVVGCDHAGSGFGGASGGGASNQGFIAGGITPSSPYTTTSTQLFDEIPVSGSFGRLVATTFHGDGSNLTNIAGMPVGLISGSAQLASRISGSFTSGFGFQGEISGSQTGSFGRVEADFIHGDGSSIKDNLSRTPGIVSGSAQIAASISGSFNKGFEYSGTIKTKTLPVAAWSTGGNLNTGRNNHNSCTGAGVSSANAVSLFGGTIPGSPYDLTGKTENYNGSTWSESGDLNDARRDGAGFGTQTAGVYTAGFSNVPTPHPGCRHTEEFDGTSWTEVTDFPHNAGYIAAAGTQNAGLVAFGGTSPVGGAANIGSPYSVEYNGTNWVNATTDTDFTPHTAQARHAMAGTQDAAITVGDGHKAPGGGPYMDNTVMNYDGSTWSVGVSTPGAVKWSSLAGTQNSVLSAGGYAMPHYAYNAIGDYTQRFDGTAWSQLSNMTTRQLAAGGAGLTGYEMTLFGNFTCTPPSSTPYATTTQEYFENFANASFHNLEITNLIGDGTPFSASLQSQLLTSVSQISNSISGSFNQGFDLQGGVSASLGLSGIAFSAGGNLNATTTGAAGFGTKAAAIAAGTTNTGAKTEEYNGSSWSEVNDLNSGRGNFQGTGTSEAAIVYGGSSNNTYTEFWNGVSWSEQNNLIMGRSGHQKLGITSQAALAIGGSTSEPGYEDADVESWNGTNWSAGTVLPAAAAWGSSAGTFDSGIVFKWPGSETFCWNGSSWSEVADRALARHCSAGAGSSNDALITGGHSPTVAPGYNTVCTELYDGNSWSTGPNLATGRGQLSSADGGNTGTANTMVFGGAGTSTEEYTNSVSTGSFGQLRGTVGGEIRTDMFNITSSTFKLPLFSDADLNYWNNEPEESTGSISGSVVRAGDVNVLNKPGSFFFHSDYNALGFTYVSASVYSQSIDFVTCTYQSASVYTASSGFITQSHYCYHNVIQYITGSYT